MSGFEKFKEELPGQEKFHFSLMGNKIIDKEYELKVLKVPMFSRFAIDLKLKR